MKKIFFSWQSDVAFARNKFKKALEIVARDLSQELEEANRPELDSDTKGVHGSEDILHTILEKISKSDVFVADVTPILKTSEKHIPNPNVMTELGYALHALPPNTRLFIFCSDIRIDMNKMPFDIRGKSLIGFTKSQAPSEVAELLKPRIAGMLNSGGGMQHTMPSTRIKLRGGVATWDNWARLLPSFRVGITVDNFTSDKPNYIESVILHATDASGAPWRTSQFLIGEQNLNQRLKIQPHDKSDISIYLNDDVGKTSRFQVPMPDLDRDTTKIEFELADGSRTLYDIRIMDKQ